ncbi:hypothetical protein B4110_0352 [Parageobacillus toebii]|uniref:Uncharacterized protein n=1 Tax=Parageobacillus toebii TaxID=153151 RepID=A0A150MS88_9BACL|nr:hypothetical protein B4110_0352 [Parageobacillus toebii]
MRFYLTYEELKHLESILCFIVNNRFYLTYEELKPAKIYLQCRKINSFYLTYEELKLAGKSYIEATEISFLSYL